METEELKARRGIQDPEAEMVSPALQATPDPLDLPAHQALTHLALEETLQLRWLVDLMRKLVELRWV